MNLVVVRFERHLFKFLHTSHAINTKHLSYSNVMNLKAFCRILCCCKSVMLKIRRMNVEDKDSILEQICRTCAELQNKLISVFEQIEISTETLYQFQLASELKRLNIQIDKDDGLPQQVCINCVKQLLNILTFRQKCKKSHEELKEFFLSNKSKQNEKNGIESKYPEALLENCVTECESENFNRIDLENEIIDLQIDSIENISENEVEVTNTDKSQEDSNSNLWYDSEVSSERLNVDLSTNNSPDNQSLNHVEESITLCNKCNKYVHSSRLKLDTSICAQLKRFNRLKISSTVEFCCFYCDDKFETKQSLQNHILQSHPIDKPFKCEQCEESFATTFKRRLHLEKIHKKFAVDETTVCDICCREFRNVRYLRAHKKFVHSDGNYECEMCYQKFTNAHKFNYHLKSHDKSKQYKCQYCDKTFMQWHHRQYHEETHQKNDRPYKCEKCGKDFVHRDKYKLHMRTHDDNLKFICEICGKDFPAKHLLNLHRTQHNFQCQCEICGKRLSSKKNLKFHRCINEENEGECRNDSKFYICPICLKKFDMPSGLQIHMKVHDKNRKYSCDYCSSSYSHSHGLQTHMNRVHLKTKHYDCPHCGKRFFDASILCVHVKTHTTRYQCSFCHKSYSAQYIKIHERTHTQEKCCVCQICGESFIHVVQLRDHYRKHNSEEKHKMEAKILADNHDSMRMQTSTTELQ